MEKTQTGHSRAWRRGDPELAVASARRSSLGLHYSTPREFDVHRARFSDRILGVVAFGAAVDGPDCPHVRVHMPVLGGDTIFEVWTSDAPVLREDAEGIASARNEDALFGCLQVDEGGDLEHASYLAYCRIFDFIDGRGYGHLLRVWNYFSGINDDERGLERYRQFSIGRHDAFVAKGRGVGGEGIPAASALGSQSGPMVIYFVAAKVAGRPVENPRQVSAYRYPAQYGPRSPTFSRAMLTRTDTSPLLFISGTASIVGHDTLHIGDPAEQARETVDNILAVIGQGQLTGSGRASMGHGLYLKAYLRHPDHQPILRDRLSKAFGPDATIVYLQADICRADLLLEVEGVCCRPGPTN